MTTRVDGRRARGDISRRRAAFAAAEIATLTGLESISMSSLSARTGLSKSGILTVFESREAIQLAAVADVRSMTIAELISPAWNKEPGTERLTQFIRNWFDYVKGRSFPGGCFLAAVSAEYAGQTGPVADAIREFKQSWIQLIESELAVGRESNERTRQMVHVNAFRLDAYMLAGNSRFQLFDDVKELNLALAECLRLIENWAE